MEELQKQRDEIAEAYFDTIPFDPYPVQEEALLAWFTEDQGVLVCAPTGTGKTLIAEAALFEALKLGKQAYYTTPLIALTDQKFREIQEKVVGWGFPAEEVGLVTGNRKLNPGAKILVVVAEILLNRLLHEEAFDFDNVWAVVMDEFHSFNDRERGIVWEFGLSLLPGHVKTMLLSATVGNAMEFSSWLSRIHDRRLKLVQSHDRKVPLSFSWVEDELLGDFVESMITGDETTRYTPALLFCFNREHCWTTGEMLKGKKCVLPAQQKQLAARLDEYDWSQGAGPKLKQLLMRGIGVHHAGVLPRYRRVVEELFQEKLLSICVCTETLAAGINLPARSVVLPKLLKGPPRKEKLMEASSAHQMFGRAGRPQFDDKGFVFALPHEDDVRIARWKEKYDSIPEDTKDPGLRKAKKALKKKRPKRREDVQYWSQQQFAQLEVAPSADLSSRGPLSWRLLVYLLDASSDVGRIRKLINGRLLDEKGRKVQQKALDRALITLWRGGYVTLDPKPPLALMNRESGGADDGAEENKEPEETIDESKSLAGQLTFGQAAPLVPDETKKNEPAKKKMPPKGPLDDYEAITATATEAMSDLLLLRGVHPLYAMFLMNHLGIADRNERIMAFESLLQMSRSVGKAVRIPKHDELPPGPLQTTRLDSLLLTKGLATIDELGLNEEDEDGPKPWDDDYVPILTLPHKLQRLFQFDFPYVDDLRISPVWIVGEVLNYGEDFNKYITSNKLQKQEGMIFRHLLRFVLLIDEMAELCPPDMEHEQWQAEIWPIANQLEAICLKADPQNTEAWLAETKKAQKEKAKSEQE
ncbi:DEAD/DEAH box helicase [Mariniblastus fucicola]|uniref:DEAD/DEAH box helicase n=1 Tax=Mariniblastus fucicola TaxID=980251 RepID=UPI000946684B|nr:DEAD/DEAH box helicase [Mariniblastus fucicola]